MAAVLKAILDRRSVRNFSSKPIDEDSLLSIIKAGSFAPSARNNKATEFLVIKNQDTKLKLHEIFSKIAVQDLVKEAPVLVMPLTDTTKANLPDFDLSTAGQNMMIQASSLGIGSVWKHIRPILVEEIRTLLHIPSHFSFCNFIVLGYPKDGEVITSHNESEFDKNKIHLEKF